MKLILISLFSLLLPAISQEIPNEKEKLLEALMNAPDLNSLNQAIEKGKKAGLPRQMFLEARFVFLVNTDDRPALAALSPELETLLPDFSPDNTMLFAVEEDFKSIVEYTKALAALQKHDTALFKKHITEAFWLSPSHATQFAPLINDLRIEEAMKKITLDLNLEFEDQKTEGQKTNLQSILGESSAFLIHFWSPWVQQSMSAMEEISIVSNTLISKNIPVISLLLSSTDEAKKDANDFLSGDGAKNPGCWLVDTEKSSLGSLMRVSTFPTVILVSREGKILFNGDPADGRLWKELTGIDPEITPPTIDTVLPKMDSNASPPAENGK
ncbi:MAG: hypothetical protein ABF382_16500 [Akkermansiaceae bacterium]